MSDMGTFATARTHWGRLEHHNDKNAVSPEYGDELHDRHNTWSPLATRRRCALTLREGLVPVEINMPSIEAFFQISNDVRYVATYISGQLTMTERPGLANASSSESDKYEELIVNPALVLLVKQRGEIDCGGVQYIVVRYGNFWQTIWPVKGGHVSIGLEPAADPIKLAGTFQRLIAEQHDSLPF